MSRGYTEEETVELMRSSRNESQWNANCNKVKASYGGEYPHFWYKAIILAGIAEQAGLNSDIKITTL